VYLFTPGIVNTANYMLNINIFYNVMSIINVILFIQIKKFKGIESFTIYFIEVYEFYNMCSHNYLQLAFYTC